MLKVGDIVRDKDGDTKYGSLKAVGIVSEVGERYAKVYEVAVNRHNGVFISFSYATYNVEELTKLTDVDESIELANEALESARAARPPLAEFIEQQIGRGALALTDREIADIENSGGIVDAL